jgi:hypothetical protein
MYWHPQTTQVNLSLEDAYFLYRLPQVMLQSLGLYLKIVDLYISLTMSHFSFFFFFTELEFGCQCQIRESYWIDWIEFLFVLSHATSQKWMLIIACVCVTYSLKEALQYLSQTESAWSVFIISITTSVMWKCNHNVFFLKEMYSTEMTLNWK